MEKFIFNYRVLLIAFERAAGYKRQIGGAAACNGQVNSADALACANV